MKVQKATFRLSSPVLVWWATAAWLISDLEGLDRPPVDADDRDEGPQHRRSDARPQAVVEERPDAHDDDPERRAQRPDGAPRHVDGLWGHRRQRRRLHPALTPQRQAVLDRGNDREIVDRRGGGGGPPGRGRAPPVGGRGGGGGGPIGGGRPPMVWAGGRPRRGGSPGCWR